MMVSLPTKRQCFLSDFVLDYNGVENHSEKRITIGEHNGQFWVLSPKSLIVDCKNIPSADSSFKSIILQSNAELDLQVYLKLRIEVEEITWNGVNAQKRVIFCGTLILLKNAI